MTDPDKVHRTVFNEGGHARFVPGPDGTPACQSLIRAAHENGFVILIVDETSYYLTARSGETPPYVALMRAHRHVPAWVLGTTQSLSGDVPQTAYNCCPHIYCFRTLSETGLDTIRRRWRLSPDVVRKLPKGACYYIFEGF